MARRVSVRMSGASPGKATTFLAAFPSPRRATCMACPVRCCGCCNTVSAPSGSTTADTSSAWWPTTCAPLKARKTVVVVGHQAEEVSAVVEPLGAETVLQQPQHGTGHAMQVARRGLGSAARIVVALPGDAPLIRTETLRALVAAHRAGNAAATILTAVVSDPSGYGRIVRKSETAVQAIVEESQLSGEQRELNEINS